MEGVDQDCWNSASVWSDFGMVTRIQIAGLEHTLPHTQAAQMKWP